VTVSRKATVPKASGIAIGSTRRFYTGAPRSDVLLSGDARPAQRPSRVPTPDARFRCPFPRARWVRRRWPVRRPDPPRGQHLPPRVVVADVGTNLAPLTGYPSAGDRLAMARQQRRKARFGVGDYGTGAGARPEGAASGSLCATAASRQRCAMASLTRRARSARPTG
jgi:hypothetical protein